MVVVAVKGAILHGGDLATQKAGPNVRRAKVSAGARDETKVGSGRARTEGRDRQDGRKAEQKCEDNRVVAAPQALPPRKELWAGRNAVLAASAVAREDQADGHNAAEEGAPVSIRPVAHTRAGACHAGVRDHCRTLFFLSCHDHAPARAPARASPFRAPFRIFLARISLFHTSLARLAYAVPHI